MRQIIDMHQHLHWNNTVEELAAAARGVGIVKMLLAGFPPNREKENNDRVLAACKQHPDLFVPYFGFDLDGMGPKDVDKLRDAGFAGIKFIGPKKAYNHESYFPVYARAAELGVPVLFHLGIVANTGPFTDCDSNLMRPIYLDHIARTHPKLTLVGAHLGNPWYDEAVMSCRWNPNLFFDLSGSTLKKKTPEYIGSLLWWTPYTAYRSPDRTYAWEKIVFGSDVHWSELKDVVHDYEVIMDTLNLTSEIRERVWYGTAARILGLDK